jgi:hypothetical protein
MPALRADAIRRTLVAALAMLLALASVGNAALAAAPEASPPTVAGVALPICHAALDDTGRGGSPGAPSRHKCCEDCLCCASLGLPAPAAALPQAIPVVGKPVAGLVPSLPRLRRAWTPHQSRAPPIA